jgi:hypothetical protein
VVVAGGAVVAVVVGTVVSPAGEPGSPILLELEANDVLPPVDEPSPSAEGVVVEPLGIVVVVVVLGADESGS